MMIPIAEMRMCSTVLSSSSPALSMKKLISSLIFDLLARGPTAS